MSDSLIHWRLCEVESFRYRTIGVLRWSRYDRAFPAMMNTIRDHGVFDTSDGFRRVIARPDPRDFFRQVTPEEIDWTGLDEALAARKGGVTCPEHPIPPASLPREPTGCSRTRRRTRNAATNCGAGSRCRSARC